VYGATKHGVLGFSESLQGDLMMSDVPITVHCVCPDGADTELVRHEAGEESSAIIWSAPRMLSADEVADKTVALLDSKRLVTVIPRYRGWQARSMAMIPRTGLHLAGLMHRMGARKRDKTAAK
jgi:short-subunit dehydrogenase